MGICVGEPMKDLIFTLTVRGMDYANGEVMAQEIKRTLEDAGFENTKVELAAEDYGRRIDPRWEAKQTLK